MEFSGLFLLIVFFIIRQFSNHARRVYWLVMWLIIVYDSNLYGLQFIVLYDLSISFKYFDGCR
jgi:hypothetical protein